MTTTENKIDIFYDMRSPYSYVSLARIRDLVRSSTVRAEWWPYIVDIERAYGGDPSNRDKRALAKVKYIYIDCRRLAQQQGLTLKSPQKIWDGNLISKAFLFAKSQGRLWQFCDPTLRSFWARDFDYESLDAIEQAIASAGLCKGEWKRYLAAEAESTLASALAFANSLGVFGAPTLAYRGELFWGGDRLQLLSARINAPLE